MSTKRRIEPGWRYTLAQFALSLLFGRPRHFISPWYNAGIASVMLPVNNGRILLGKRAGQVEHVGCYSGIGGFVDIDKGENFAQAIVRECFEETGLQLDINQFPINPHTAWLTFNQQKHEQADYTVAVGYYFFEVPEDFIQKLTPQEETEEFVWFTPAQCEQLLKEGKIPAEFTDLPLAIREVARRLKAKEKFARLKL